ncbi:hypothetical protein BN1723_007599 [Verticillium longisporum]|uniref:Amine oxidase n=2 Tax=Verticillium longisporum TaxID=100787 RepID=A0A0G4NM53_VERLO|nr:hypothetical protein BN1723_007599 [Verticillium longisporum]
MCPPTNRPADDGPPIRVAIIGTGLAGLTTAHLLQNDDKNRYEVTLFEQANGLSFDAASVAVRNEVTRHKENMSMASDEWITQSIQPIANAVNNSEKDAAPAARKRVIIVGAGIAGLRAAAVLLEKDIDVVVVEARDRIGGRMLTAEVGKDKLDMGAAWMHGTCPLHFAEFGPPGSQFKAGNVADEFLDYLSYWLQREPDAPDVTADEHIRKFVRQHELLTEGEHVWAPEALRLHEATLGLRVEDISSKFFLDMLPPERDLYVKGGYRRIVEHPHGRHQIKLEISLRDDEYAESTLQADAVIVTVPLGVLKADTISFEPILPSHLLQGISRISYGALGKVFFEFREVFWSRHNDSLIYFPTPPELAADSEKNKNHVLGHCFLVTNLYMMTGTPRLCVLLAPPMVQELEAMAAGLGGSQAVFDYFEPLLEVFRLEPLEPLPPVVDIKVTNWTTDELAGFGTYSTAKVGDDPNIWWDALDEEKGSKLQFAGEHCTSTATGCVHGAFESGEEAAKRVLSALGQK